MNILPPSISVPPPTVVVAITVVTLAVGLVLAVYVDSLASVADVVSDAVLLAGSSVGVLVSVVEADSVEDNSVLEDAVVVGVGVEPVEEASVEYVAAVAAMDGVFTNRQRA